MIDATLANRLQVWGFEDGITVFKDFSLGAAFKISSRDISCETAEKRNLIKEDIRQFLNGLPQGLSLQFMQEIVPGNSEVIQKHLNLTKDDVPEAIKHITQERVNIYSDLDKAGWLPQQNLYLFIRKPFENSPQKVGWLSVFSKKKTELSEKVLQNEIHHFSRVLENLSAGLYQLNIQADRLPEQDIFRLLYEQWNPHQKISAPQMSTQDIRDQVILTDVVIGLDHFLMGKTHHKVISLKLLPELTHASLAEELQNLPFKSKLFLSVQVENQNKEIEALQLQRRMAYASVVGKKGVSDLEAQAKLQDIEGILEEAINGTEKIFRFALNIVLKGENPEELEDQTAATLALLRQLNGAEGILETVAAFDVFTEISLPNARAKERALKVNTSVLADFIPIYGHWKGHEKPSVLLRRSDGGLLPFDPFSESLTSANMVVSGGSGSGKSFFVNLLISQMLKESPKVFILDIGGSYRRVCENLGGQYIELGLKSDLAINPFSFEGINSGASEEKTQKLKFLVTLVELMTKEYDQRGLGKLETSEVEKAIATVLSEEPEPRLSHLMTKLLAHEDKEIQRLGKIMGLWCGDSPFGRLIDRPTTVNFNKDVVCFDLKGLESHPELQAVYLFIITDLIWREVQKDKTQMKITIFDECWRLLQDQSASLFIGEVFRTFRKYRASAIAISQTMDDFINSNVASAILPNSPIKWLLKQKEARLEVLESALRLNEKELSIIGSLTSVKGKYSEVFLMAGENRKLIQVESTPLEYWLFTTDPADYSLLEKTKRLKPELSDFEILRSLADSHPSGAQNSKKEAT